MNNPLVSVIVPIYMVDRYVGLCIESIIKQTYKNLEIILVDDGSRDRCSEICDLYALKDERIRVIHKVNGGLVSARKSGLQQARGEFISYIDGDDWVEPTFIERLCVDSVVHKADMVCAAFSKDLFSQSISHKHTMKIGLYEELETLWKSMLSYGSYYRPGITTYVWNKLFRREIVSNMQSRVDNRITLGEDAAVTYPTLLACKRVFLSDNCDYHYRQREDSMLKQNSSYINDAQKLVYLYEYMMNWAASTPTHLNIKKQVIDYILSIAIIRSGGRLPNGDFSIFNNDYYCKNVIIYSAGTFGQQLVNRFKENKHCNVIAWVDDDFWEYRRCCLDVDSVSSIYSLDFDYILIATVDEDVAGRIKKDLVKNGIDAKKVLTIEVLNDKEYKQQLLNKFLDINALKIIGSKGVISHA